MKRIFIKVLLIIFVFGYDIFSQPAKFKKVQWQGEMTEIVADEILLKVSDQKTADSLIQHYNLVIKRKANLNGWFLTSHPDPISVIKKIKTAISLNKIIAKTILKVEPNFIIETHSIKSSKNLVPPKDSLLIHEWALKYIHWFESLSEVEPGQSEIIGAILDSGFPFIETSNGNFIFHEDIGSNDFIFGKDFSDEEEKDLIGLRDLYGHGTFIIGQIKSLSNEKGIVGITYGYPAKIVISQIWNRDGKSDALDLAEAIKHAVDLGARVINVSGGGLSYPAIEEDAVSYARDHGVIIVASAGNRNTELDYPARFAEKYKNVISVGGIDKNGKRVFFSSFGQGLILMAPSVNIVSTTPFYKFLLEDSDDWSKYYFQHGAGTSFAAPFVYGLIIMMLSKDPELTYYQIRHILIETAEHVGGVDYVWNGKSYFNDQYGYGCVNVLKALEKVEEITKLKKTPKDYILKQNYPNPFKATTVITYDLLESQHIKLSVYDILGREIAILVNRYEEAGTHNVYFKATHLSKGIYFVKIRAGNYITAKKIILIQ